MKTRRAILVASPDIPNELLPGARRDVENFADFLTSLEGGAWENAEISKLFNPTKAELLQTVRYASWLDYVFLTFSGHGCHRVGHELSETSLTLTATESCNVLEINPRNERHFLIVDACRAIVRETETEGLIRRKMVLANAAMRPTITREQARALFDDAVAAADAGRVVAYSCQIGQAAGESQSGGVFSRSLVREAASWAYDAPSNAVLSAKEGFDLAQAKTYELNAPQRAELEAGRRLRHFPLAVSPNAQRVYG
jgi:hypothetical protein